MITINGRILENTYTTAQWAATTTILENRVRGYEYANDGVTPVGSKMGDGIHLWADLPYWYIVAETPPIEVPIPVNSDGYFEYSYDGSRGTMPLTYVQQIVGSDIVNRFDITVKINGAGDTITALADFSMDSYQLVIRK